MDGNSNCSLSDNYQSDASIANDDNFSIDQDSCSAVSWKGNGNSLTRLLLRLLLKLFFLHLFLS